MTCMRSLVAILQWKQIGFMIMFFFQRESVVGKRSFLRSHRVIDCLVGPLNFYTFPHPAWVAEVDGFNRSVLTEAEVKMSEEEA